MFSRVTAHLDFVHARSVQVWPVTVTPLMVGVHDIELARSLAPALGQRVRVDCGAL